MTEPTTARDTIDRTAKGMSHVTVLALDRLRSAITAVERGEFSAAYKRGEEALAKLGALASAEVNLASLAEHVLMRAGEVSPGASVYGYGVVKFTDDELSRERVRIEFTDGAVIEWGRDQEFLVLLSEDGS